MIPKSVRKDEDQDDYAQDGVAGKYQYGGACFLVYHKIDSNRFERSF